jgi:hypothetical protein
MQGRATDTDEKTEEEIRIAIRLAYADPGRDSRKATVFILCTYTSTKSVYKTTGMPLIPSSHSALLSSPGLLPPLALSRRARLI